MLPDKPCRKLGLLGKATITDLTDKTEMLADIGPSGSAGIAFTAIVSGVCGDQITDGKLFDTLANR